MPSPALTPPLPRGACDCHTHVFLDAREFPFDAARHYPPPPASVGQLVALHEALGIERVVLVQPSVYGADNRATLHALRQLGPQRARGVAVIDDRTPEAELDGMHAAGVRGVRVNLHFSGDDTRAATEALRRTAARVAPRGWHVQVYAPLALLARCADALGTLPATLVLDHHAGAQVTQTPPGVLHELLQPVLALVAGGQAYVKLSAPYRGSSAAGHADLAALTRRFLACNPERLLWGSDWPHPQPGAAPTPTELSPPHDVDNAAVLQRLRAWVGDEAAFKRMLVDNPQRLYDFD
jgi:predicted TIM-barrel fold metal-dependent hydrolase